MRSSVINHFTLIKDLLSQLNHYNATIRHEACLGFRDLFQSHPEIMHEQINSWIPKLLDKMTDTDAAVRHSFTLCMQHVSRNLPIHEISPFIHIIVAHLCCGMTHINEAVQLDSLSILELILDYFPRLMVSYSHKILPSLIDLMSKQGKRETNSSQSLNTSKVKGISSLVSRDVSFNVEGKMSSLKARTKVLSKLQKVLFVLFDNDEKTNDRNDNWDSDQTVYVTGQPVYSRLNNHRKFNLIGHERTLEDWLQIASDQNQGQDHYAVDFFYQIYPVLLNSWIEYEPGQLASGLNDSSSIRASLPGMTNVIGILNIFVTLSRNNKGFQLFENEASFKEFCTHFLKSFALPLTFTKMKSIAKQETTNDIQRFAMDFNFVMAKTICQLFSKSAMLTDGKLRARYLKQLMVFCSDVLENSGLLSKEKILAFMDVFEEVMKLKRSLKSKEGSYIDCNHIIQTMIQCYSRGSVTSPWKIPLLQFFQKLCFEKDSNWLGADMLDHLESIITIVIKNVWSLPSSALGLIRSSLVFIKVVSVCQFCQEASMQEELQKTLIKMTDITNGFYHRLDEQTFQKVIELLHSLKSLPTQLLKNATMLCFQSDVTLRNKKYLMSVVALGLQKEEPSLAIEDFINFIFTITINYTMASLTKSTSEQESTAVKWSILNLYDDQKKDALSEYAIEQLQVLENISCLYQKMLIPVGKILAMFRHLPISSAYGIIKLVSRLTTWSNEDDRKLEGESQKIETLTINCEINQIADLVSAVLLYTISGTYKSLIQTTQRPPSLEKTNDCYHDALVFDLMTSAVNLLANNELVLRQLVKKWINIVREYDMDANCIISIAEVLLALLQEPLLNGPLRELKSELNSITNIQMNAATRTDAAVLKQLRFVIKEYWQ
ncbi:testis-expressed protein 10-like isoform X2 [Clytia hemisphaerica]|uniref:testis-expressed protein 10-like isoform X2 n=1 Tax=Clytia hemisphaerica TaxID=252671 RepID=UPI0034D5C2ED